MFNNFQIATSNDSIEQLVIPAGMISVGYLYLFLSNYAAQEVTEHNNYLFATV